MTARRTIRAYIGLGANIGDATATLTGAVRALDALAGARVHGVSPLYATAPWGVTDQPEFRNAVVALDVTVEAGDPPTAALTLLADLKRMERDAGRGAGARWGPRELDLDILVFGRHRIATDRPPDARSNDAETDPDKATRRLEIPHRDAGERLFVLTPLADLAPRLVPPGWSETVATRRRRIAAAEPPDAVRRIGRWDEGRGRWV